MRDGLELRDEQVAESWETLRTTGNLSSSSVLLVLERVLHQRRPPRGSHGLMVAMGPGFCSEQVLLGF